MQEIVWATAIIAHFFSADKRKCMSASSGTSGTTNTMYIIFFILWQIIVENSFDIIDIVAQAIDEARSNIHVGGSVVHTELDADDVKIVDAVRDTLVREGLI